jgi:hypothetical protein
VGGIVKTAENLVDISPCDSGIGYIRELELYAVESLQSECTGCCNARTNAEFYSACKQNVSIVADDPFTGKQGYKGRKQSKKRWSHLYEQIMYDHAQIISMHEHRCTNLRTIKTIIIKGKTKELKETVRERAKRERERKRNKTEKSLAERDSTNTYPRDIGEHLLAENIGEHLFAKTENWNNKEVEGKRTWGYKGTRVGEASQPGPMAEDTHETFEERINNRFNSEVLEKVQGPSASHENWSLDDLDKRGASTGMRVATNNFERKLYASKANYMHPRKR